MQLLLLIFWAGPCSVTQLCPAMFDPVDCSSPVSSSHGIFQGRILDIGWPFPTLGDLLDPGIEPAFSCISCVGRWILYHYATWEAPTTTITRTTTATTTSIAQSKCLFQGGVPLWKQSKCPWTDEWIKKMWCLRTCMCIYLYISLCI